MRSRLTGVKRVILSPVETVVELASRTNLAKAFNGSAGFEYGHDLMKPEARE